MAQSVQSFHAAASTAASSVANDGASVVRGNGFSVAGGSSRWGGSVVGDMPSSKRLWIREWQESRTSLAQDSSAATTPDAVWSDAGDNESRTTITSPLTAVEEEKNEFFNSDVEIDDDSDLELDIIQSLDQLAEEKYHAQFYAEAEGFLQKRLSKSLEGSTSSSPSPDIRKVELRLVCCQLLQCRWDPCARNLLRLVRDASTPLDPAVPTLLHALASGFSSDGNHRDAERYCKVALQTKRKMLGKTSPKYTHTLSLLGAIAVNRGDLVEAQALRRTLPLNDRTCGLSARDGMTGCPDCSDEIGASLDRIWGKPQSAEPSQGDERSSLVEERDAPNLPKEDKEDIFWRPLVARDLESLVTEMELDEPVDGDQAGAKPPSPSVANSPGPKPHPKLPSTDIPQVYGVETPQKISKDGMDLSTFYQGLYADHALAMSSVPSSLARFSSGTDSDKEVIHNPFDYAHRIVPHSLWPNLPGGTVLGRHGKLVCSMDWSPDKDELMPIIRYVRFLELCEQERRNTEKPPNSTDTFKEVYMGKDDEAKEGKTLECGKPLASVTSDTSSTHNADYFGRLQQRLAEEIGRPDNPGPEGRSRDAQFPWHLKPATFEEMGIPQGRNVEDCIVM